MLESYDSTIALQSDGNQALMCVYIMNYLNFLLSCSVKNLTLASLTRLFKLKSDVNYPFTSFFFHNGL